MTEAARTVADSHGDTDQTADVFGVVPRHSIGKNLEGANVLERGDRGNQIRVWNVELAPSAGVDESGRGQHAPVVAAVIAAPHTAGLGVDKLPGAFKDAPQHGVDVSGREQRRRCIDKHAQGAFTEPRIDIFHRAMGEIHCLSSLQEECCRLTLDCIESVRPGDGEFRTARPEQPAQAWASWARRASSAPPSCREQEWRAAWCLPCGA